MAKIPIEDDTNKVDPVPEETPEEGAAPSEASGSPEAPGMPGAAPSAESADPAGDAPDQVPSSDDGTDNADGADDDLIAEAEAIVEEAAGEAADVEAGVSTADQLQAAQAQAQEWQDRYLRLHAEWDTYRRRMGEQRAEEKARATEGLMEDLPPVLDDFERTVAYADENGEVGLLDGVKAVQTKLLDALAKSGLVMIDPAGEPYDALEAQAVQMVPDDEAFDETVRDVYQKGYKMGKKVLRPAMVTVTTGGPKRPKPEEPEEE